MTTRQDKTYHAYCAAKARCTNPKNPRYNYYGERGIQFRFESFQEFVDELGPRPDGWSLDRINNDGHYEIGNVRWATHSIQCSNQRTRQNSTYKVKGVSTNRSDFVAYHGATNTILYRGKDFFDACCARKSWESVCQQSL